MIFKASVLSILFSTESMVSGWQKSCDCMKTRFSLFLKLHNLALDLGLFGIILFLLSVWFVCVMILIIWIAIFRICFFSISLNWLPSVAISVDLKWSNLKVLFAKRVVRLLWWFFTEKYILHCCNEYKVAIIYPFYMFFSWRLFPDFSWDGLPGLLGKLLNKFKN